MLNEKKLTKSELAKREDIIMKMKKNKRALVQKYGKDAEQVMYGRATNIAKKQAESMENDKLKEMIKDALKNPKAADLNKDGKLSDYEEKRGAAIEKNLDEMDLNDPIAMRMRAEKDKLAKIRAANAGDDGNDEFFDAAKLRALKKKRAQIMRDMEQEAEMEGGPIADKYGDMLNKLDQAISMLSEDTLEEGASTEEKRIAMRAIKSIAKYRGVSNDEARNDLVRAAKEIGDLKEGFYGPGSVESVANALGYSDVYEFFEDNPGAVDAVLDWAEMVPEFNEMLQDADFLQEDLDLGHQDDEPHMLKADLYRIGKYAMELYQMVDRFEEGSEEVDFPHWWQSKVIKAKDMLVSAKHYLDFEVKEPQIDAMVDVAAEEEVVNEGVWSLGTAEQIVKAIQSLEMLQGMDAASISDSLEEDGKFYYNVLGDDLFHDALDNAERSAAMGDLDRAQNGLADAIGRAEDLLAFVQKREGLQEEATNTRHIEDHEYMAAKIQKAMNDLDKSSEDYESKLYRLQQARKANNNGDFKTAMKIMKPFLAEGKVCESCGKMHEGSCGSSIAEKLAKQLKNR